MDGEERFADEETDEQSRPSEPIDHIKMAKASSLALGGISIALSVMYRLNEYSKNFVMPKVIFPNWTIVIPNIPFEDATIVFGMVSLVPYIAISLYEKYMTGHATVAKVWPEGLDVL